MLDLNVNIAESTCDNEEEMALELEKLTQVEDSGYSNSSIVIAKEGPNFPFNGRDTDSSINNTSTFIFDILKKGKEGLFLIKHPSTTGIVRGQFLPVTGEKEDKRADSGVGISLGPQWLNLSFADSAGGGGLQQPELRPKVKQSRRGPKPRSSRYRGVTFYQRTGRWESHIWDCGKQVYLGGFDTAHAAARTYDRAAIMFRGFDADINFHLSDYEEDIKHMRNLSKKELVLVLRQQNKVVSRGSSKYRGVSLHKCGPREATTGQFLGNK
ncbi:hypothetical protein UlMin_025798 [Ulmus minor]